MSETLRAPFPWFGGKSSVADLVWWRFGDVPNYVEPFFGSGAVLLGRPGHHRSRCETVNDKDGYIANFWRAVQHQPEEVAAWADQPVNENDLHSRHAWLVGQTESLVPKLEGDPDFYDAKIAGWWVWGICCWIGHGWCSGKGPWSCVGGKLVHLGNAGRGVNRQLVHLGNAGRGVNRQRVLITNDGVACTRLSGAIVEWFGALCSRLRLVRVCCGDWQRVCGPTPTVHQGLTGVFLDPPYSFAGRADCYNVDDRAVGVEAGQWAAEHGSNPKLRIALCGYEGDWEPPAGWSCVAWKPCGGYGSQSRSANDNARKERIWFSPHCLPASQKGLFDDGPEN